MHQATLNATRPRTMLSIIPHDVGYAQWLDGSSALELEKALGHTLPSADWAQISSRLSFCPWHPAQGQQASPRDAAVHLLVDMGRAMVIVGKPCRSSRTLTPAIHPTSGVSGVCFHHGGRRMDAPTAPRSVPEHKYIHTHAAHGGRLTLMPPKKQRNTNPTYLGQLGKTVFPMHRHRHWPLAGARVNSCQSRTSCTMPITMRVYSHAYGPSCSVGPEVVELQRCLIAMGHLSPDVIKGPRRDTALGEF